MFDRHLEPPEPSKDEQWVDDRVEAMEEEVNNAIDLMVFETLQGVNIADYIDWDKLRQDFYELAEAELDEKKAERAIEQWEDRQRWNDF